MRGFFPLEEPGHLRGSVLPGPENSLGKSGKARNRAVRILFIYMHFTPAGVSASGEWGPRRGSTGTTVRIHIVADCDYSL